MLDINKSVIDPLHYEKDPEGNLFDLPQWSPQYANQQAALIDLVLTDEHWEVIYYLRERYRVNGNRDSARAVLRDLEEHFGENRGRARLYELFPRGPVTQATQLAGLPLPAHALDLSFGSAM